MGPGVREVDGVRRVTCWGCGALVPDIEGPTHPYIGASAGCWAAYGVVMAREFGEFRYPPVHLLTTDTYAVQHPGVRERRAISSVAVHLIRLCLVLERHVDTPEALRAIRRAVAHKALFRWLAPPSFAGTKTILDVRAHGTLPEHEQAVRDWADSVWRAWAPHHETVRTWIEVTQREPAPGAP